MLKLIITTDETGPGLREGLVKISNLLHVDVEAVGLDGYVSERVSYPRSTQAGDPHPVLEKADPPSVETVPEPVAPAPAETPAE